ncbi:MAG: efflux RND transporter periplasmic adaptor subunit [Pirellulaceae bacterium]|nr:efflux RND transporter periplasmic adaptor subunit [Pirellulaceae bacterium]
MRLALVVTVALNGCDRNAEDASKAQSSKPIALIRAETMTVQAHIWPRRVRTQGSLVVDEVSEIGAKVPGRVSEVNVDLGDPVQSKDRLLKIDDEQYKLLVEQAEAQLAQARSAVGLREGDPLEKMDPENAPPVREAKAVYDEAKQAVERIRRLSIQNAVSATDLEVAEAAERIAAARLASAQNSVREKIAMVGVQSAQLGLARQNLVDTEIRAPFAGVIQRRQVAVGTYVQTGQSLVTLVSNTPLRFRAAVPERYAHDLRIGQKMLLRVELSNQQREIEITRLSPTLDPASRALSFEALVHNHDQSLRSGMFGEAEIILDPQATAVVVPTKSILRFAGVDKVWKIENDMIREQAILLGRQEDDRTEILSGLKVGDTILIDGSQGKAGRFEAIEPATIGGT